MSTSIVEAQEIALEEDEELVTSEEEGVVEEESESEDEAKSEDKGKFDLPEKFQGKSIEDIVASYENLEREFGRKNNTIGEQRKLIDQLIALERPKEAEVEEETLDADALLDDPNAAIQKAIENNPTLKAIQERLESRDRATAQEAFMTKHPDAESLFKDAEFAKWITKNPTRQKMFVDADANYDFATVSDILDDWKEIHPSKTTEESDASEDSGDVEQAAKDLTTETKTKAQAKKRKIYSRSYIVNMMVNDPEQYERRKEEFRKAYEDGRVRR